MGIILDSSILIADERRRFDLAGFFLAHPEDTFGIAAITASELLHGVERANTAERRQKRQSYVEAVLNKLPVIDFDLRIARQHARLWASLEVVGKLIGPHDMLIAATALAEDHRAATLNQDEFVRVPGLNLVDLKAFSMSA
jgi:tRNA(fMet)-specific endonuclease VapC